MRYISTRGGIEPLQFQDAVMMGLARDGGLLLPQTLPTVDTEVLDRWQHLPYQYLAREILSLFIDDIPQADLEDLIERAYASFAHPQVTPVTKRGDVYILELFHGPTLAFKDVALQLLGNLFEYVLARTGGFMNILGATSGDTGSAAIAGVRGKNKINIFILHPHGRTSPIQALQMTTVLDPNVFNIAVRGTFDDAQSIVKAIFNDLDFRDRYRLGAVNSINWARVLAQVVYYVYAYLKLRKLGSGSVDFSVPTGNFGDIFAGYVAKTLLPAGCIHTLILATNANDILARFVSQGDYSRGQVQATSSPSMDIQIASNFERYLYYLRGEDGAAVKADMEGFAATGKLDLSAFTARVAQDFRSRAVSEEETIATIGAFHREHGYLLDPHTAVGVKAALDLREPSRPVVCLATAHPAKFGEAVTRAIGSEPPLPLALADLANRESRCVVLDAEVETVKEFVARNGLQ
ncbi:L-threonine synthase [Desulfobulbus propionicus DSM 2032]|jgi:threonine synthase|uniref:Threonine synthase n=1 Tax=Desulfobulbus propionicus (strain ATCC 33891 / DSM 2032 / VKM B-1956 / 1pr3) TaxID=577650 RepID=A0A7U4DNJ0_DESPD|nr:threonine synthase [Desulfobulbus propionicus]ADW17064.1 L-threonine synthase [Desulfobulbus propionicus DSM 2032]